MSDVDGPSPRVTREARDKDKGVDDHCHQAPKGDVTREDVTREAPDKDTGVDDHCHQVPKGDVTREARDKDTGVYKRHNAAKGRKRQAANAVWCLGKARGRKTFRYIGNVRG